MNKCLINSEIKGECGISSIPRFKEIVESITVGFSDRV